MKFSTVRTSAGFLKTMIGKYMPIKLGKNNKLLEDIYNYRQYTDSLCSSGQPSEAEFRLIREAGFCHVINLAPHDGENSLADEAKTTADLGMRYTHIPVDFKKPTQADFDAFVAAYEACGDNKVWVHCAANMRVSAFLYKYRRDHQGLPEAQARAIMDTVWEPFGVWRRFLR